MNLMLDGLNVWELTRGTACPIVTYHDAYKKIVGRNPTPECFLDECTKHPSTDALKDFLKSVLADQFIQRTEYQCWQQTIAKEQSSFFKHLKNNLKEWEFLVICDFPENYAFAAQNAAQAFDWNNDQFTIFTTVIYYKKDNKLKHWSVYVYSIRQLNHDTIGVYEFQIIITDNLKENFKPKNICSPFRF